MDALLQIWIIPIFVKKKHWEYVGVLQNGFADKQESMREHSVPSFS